MNPAACSATFLLASVLASSRCGAAAPPPSRALLSSGNPERLQHVFAKARRGERLTVGVIGGSITAGAKASIVDNRYGNRIADWVRQKFPGASIDFVNAGIGATGSNYAALRARRDLLARNPDLVVVEFGVNDRDGTEAGLSLEGLLRQVLSEPQQPAVILLFMMAREGRNAQKTHAPLGVHYGLPMVSFRDALWPEIEAGRLPWEEYIADEVHPNDAGHALAAEYVISCLAQVADAVPVALPPLSRQLPPPLNGSLFERTELREAPALEFEHNAGWTLETPRQGACWVTSTPGSSLEFSVSGQWLGIMFWRIRGPMGRARLTVDDRPPETLEAWFAPTWGGYRVLHTVADLAPGRHRVRLELLEERHAESTGNEFRLLGIGAAGVEP